MEDEFEFKNQEWLEKEFHSRIVAVLGKINDMSDPTVELASKLNQMVANLQSFESAIDRAIVIHDSAGKDKDQASFTWGGKKFCVIFSKLGILKVYELDTTGQMKRDKHLGDFTRDAVTTLREYAEAFKNVEPTRLVSVLMRECEDYISMYEGTWYSHLNNSRILVSQRTEKCETLERRLKSQIRDWKLFSLAVTISLAAVAVTMVL